MLKFIKSFSDVEYIVRYKLDVIDRSGYKVPFVRFMSMSLIDIINLFDTGWRYDPTVD